MPTLPNMNLITPTLGGDSGTWDDKINAALGLIDAHDHTSGKGVRVPVAGLNINTDIAMGGMAITGLKYAAFNAITALSSGITTLFVNTADNELYWRTAAGANVKLTSGAGLNISLVGGIVGDYSSVGAEVAYDDANDRYTFKQQGGSKPWARLASGPVRIYEFNTTESVYVEHAVAAALAASYTVTWPAAVPSETVAVKMDAAGVVSVGRTTKTKTVSLLNAIPYKGTNPNDTSGFVLDQTAGIISWKWPTASATSYQLYFPVEVDEGSVLTTIDFYIAKNSNSSTTLAFTLYSADTTGTFTQISTTNYAGNATGNQTVTLPSIAHAVGSSKTYYAAVTINNATPSAADKHFGCKLTYTDPY